MPTALFHSIISDLGSVALVVLFFGGSIFVHELGHFWAARRRGVHVERFSIGFGPKIVSWRGKDGVEYRLSWLPIGGYVALPQLADMSVIEGESTADTKTLPPISYATKIIVFAAGAAMNLVFALVLACIIWFIGEPVSSDMATTRIGYVSPTIELSDGTKVPSPASQAGLRIGDIVRAIDGVKVTDWASLTQTLITSAGRDEYDQPMAVFTIERDGRELEIVLFPRLAGDERYRHVGISQSYELLVHDVAAGSAAEKAGFKPGDEIRSLDGQPISNIAVYQEHLDQHVQQTVLARVKRAGQELELRIPPRANAKTGTGLTLTTGFTLTHPSPLAQLWEQTTMTFRILWSLINPHSDIGLSKVAGAVGIARIFYSAAEAGIRTVLIFTILVNVNLAIFNLLPIPVLDGGHMLFATIARLRGRALPVNLVMTAQSVFMVLLFSMIIYVFFFDVKRLVRDVQADRAEAAAPAK
ncbi:MAG TPA: RIP metalloprotease RseP [Opitutaceae bacterium]|nr:RIP metalloprotease RseP [Opitutaceae bacterium]